MKIASDKFVIPCLMNPFTPTSNLTIILLTVYQTFLIKLV